MGFAAKTAATAGLVSAPVIALSEGVLRIMALARLKLAMGITVAIGVTATVAWVGAHREPRAFDRPKHANPRPNHEAPAVINSPTHEPSRSQPKAAAPYTGKEAGPLLAGRAFMSSAKNSQKNSTDRSPDGVPDSSRPAGDSIYADSRVQTQKPASAEAAKPEQVSRNERAVGEMLFAKEWVPNDPMSHGGDGLGPVYNDTSCVACHGLGSPGGAGPESKNVVIMTASPNGCGKETAPEVFHPGFGGSKSAVLHHYGTDPRYSSWRRGFPNTSSSNQPNHAAGRDEGSVQARINALKEQTAPERRLSSRSVNVPTMNGFTVRLSERNTPPLFGVGQIDKIPSEVLVAVAALQPEKTRGRVSRTREGRIGRFGWKGQVSSLHEFVRIACANELGLEVPGHSQAASPLAPLRKGKGVDLTDSECDALAAYVRALPAPVVVDPFGPMGTHEIREGRQLFAEIGCVACHAPMLGPVRGIYSDLLLHDLGSSLSDAGGGYGVPVPSSSSEAPTPQEWRTPPLWGFRDSGPYLHDGRAENLAEAIALHEGQGTESAHRFFSLSSRQRLRVEAFLKSLVAPWAAAAPGVVLAAEMESRIVEEEEKAPESVVRQSREKEANRAEQNWRETHRRRMQAEAAKRARIQIPIAQSLEKMGKITGAIAFYEEIVRQAAGTPEGRLAAERVAALSPQAR
jgi:CxxC motif-containing protein (DUF1111 family)